MSTPFRIRSCVKEKEKEREAETWQTGRTLRSNRASLCLIAGFGGLLITSLACDIIGLHKIKNNTMKQKDIVLLLMEKEGAKRNSCWTIWELNPGLMHH
jgi:hypothetical protein